MTKRSAFFATVLALGAFPSAADAACVATGEVSSVYASPSSTLAASTPTLVHVRSAAPAQPTYIFSASDDKVVNALLIAQSFHMRVKVAGSAASCPAPVNSAVQAGAVKVVITAP